MNSIKIFTVFSGIVAIFSIGYYIFLLVNSPKDGVLMMGNKEVENNEKYAYSIYASPKSDIIKYNLPLNFKFKNTSNNTKENFELILTSTMKPTSDGQSQMYRLMRFNSEMSVNDKIQEIKLSKSHIHANDNIHLEGYLNVINDQNTECNLKKSFDPFEIELSMSYNDISKKFNCKLLVVPLCYYDCDELINEINAGNKFDKIPDMYDIKNYRKYLIITNIENTPTLPNNHLYNNCINRFGYRIIEI